MLFDCPELQPVRDKLQFWRFSSQELLQCKHTCGTPAQHDFVSAAIDSVVNDSFNKVYNATLMMARRLTGPMWLEEM